METISTKSIAKKKKFQFKDLPKVNFSHVNSLTDDTGIIQHAIFNIPNRKEGYCIDDNARALLLSVLNYNNKDHKEELPLKTYLSFIHYMQTENGEFKNFMSYTKAATEAKGSEDSFGRTLMALGYLMNGVHLKLLTQTAAGIFSKAYCHIDKLVSLRGIANSIIGVCEFVKYNYPDDIKRDLVIKLADKMMNAYSTHKEDGWNWFETILTYDNAILPLALLNAYEITSDENYFTVAFETMEFLESKVLHGGVFSPIGNQGWCEQGKETFARFDQQGIDAMAMVLFYKQAYRITSDEIYLSKMYTCYQWFLGNNDLKLPLYDSSTGGCADGLHIKEVNQNQGAESTLAYWISHMIVASELKP